MIKLLNQNTIKYYIYNNLDKINKYKTISTTIKQRIKYFVRY